MSALEFNCVVRTGQGKHAHMVIPGRSDLPDAPKDWPETLCPGSLNAGVSSFPPEFDALGVGEGLKKLDEGKFRPEFVIPKAKIKNNSRGDGQVWRARLRVSNSGAEVECWVFRRIGSTIKRQIELVAADHLRQKLNVNDGTEIVVTIFEGTVANIT